MSIKRITENNTQKTKKIRKGDKVFVIAGNYKGQTGTVLRCMGDKIVVQGINFKKKHVKPTQQNPKGNILTIEAPIHVSNVKLCVGEKPVKVKVQSDEKGNRTLCYVDNGKDVQYRTIKKPAE